MTATEKQALAMAWIALRTQAAILFENYGQSYSFGEEAQARVSAVLEKALGRQPVPADIWEMIDRRTTHSPNKP
jgi:hypothetical protein